MKKNALTFIFTCILMNVVVAASNNSAAVNDPTSEETPSQFEALLILQERTYKAFTKQGELIDYKFSADVIPHIEDGKVVKVKFGKIFYTPENDFFPRYFENDGRCMGIINGKLYIWELDYYGNFDRMLNICVPRGKVGGRPEKHTKVCANYWERIQVPYEAAKQAEVQREAEVELAREEKYGLRGKDIQSIKVVYLDNNEPTGAVFVGDSYEIGFETTLTNGFVIKTPNLGGKGYMKDINIRISQGKAYQSEDYGASYQATYEASGRDNVTLEVSSKYGSEVYQTISHPISYTTSKLTLTHTGQDGYSGYANGDRGGPAGHGSPLKIEVKTIKHSETGTEMYALKVTDGFSKDVDYYRMHKSATLKINAYGGTGGQGAQGRDKSSDNYGQPGTGGTGGRGGNGGDIELILDPSAKDLKYDVDNEPGSGGSGGRGGACWSCPYGDRGDWGSQGPSGSSGSFRKVVQPVNWN